MKWHRMQAILLRHWYQNMHDTGNLIGFIYWPLIDLLLWGITSLYLKSISSQGAQIVVVLVSGAVLSQLIYRSYYDFMVPIMFERWDRNLINLFASPITFTEWIVSVLLYDVIRTLIGFSVVTTVAYHFYDVNLLLLGQYFIPIMMLFMMSGWWIGFLVVGLSVLKGRRMDVVIWSVTAFLSPFSAIYYPVSILPQWAQNISHLLPQSYIFEAMRQILTKKPIDTSYFVISAVLNVVYLLIAILFFQWCFKKLLQKGLININ